MKKDTCECILGLDVSSATTGWAVLDKQEKILDSGYIRTDLVSTGKKDIYLKVKTILKELHSIINNYNITTIVIEEPLKSFFKGKSSATTIAKLNFFNGMVSSVISTEFGINPKHLPASTLRSKAKIKKDSKKGETSKDAALRVALDKGWIAGVEYNSNGKIIPQLYDQVDAIVVALGGKRKLEELKKEKNT